MGARYNLPLATGHRSAPWAAIVWLHRCSGPVVMQGCTYLGIVIEVHHKRLLTDPCHLTAPPSFAQ